MSTHLPLESCECCGGTSRREFIKTTASGIAVAATGILPAMAAPDARMAKVHSKAGQPETLVATFYKSLTEQQRQAVVFPFDHPLRSKVDNNWFITDKKVSKFY
ncbi:MAG TPA: twin-arginine translocation signal domain-containing protein, partial [Verrucomicrobiae bacterium]